MVKNARIVEALADLETQEAPNFSAAAIDYDCERTTLMRRFKGQTTSREEAISIHRQCLTRSQEKALVDLINRLTDRGMPPTSRIVKNLTEEIRGIAVGMNWTACFVKRHEKELRSLYLKTIDNE